MASEAEDCGKSPWTCLTQSVGEGVTFVVVLGFISLLMHETIFSFDQVALFLSLYVPVLFALRATGFEMGEQLGRAAGWAIATKMMNALVI